MSALSVIILLALLGGVLGLVGGLVMLLVKPWTKALAAYAVPFAAGVLLTVSLLGIIPEAVEVVGESAFLVVFLGFLASYLFESAFFALHHHNGHAHEAKGKASVSLIIFGDTIHNLIDGVAIAAAYLINPGLGLITAISTFLHEVPHEIGDFGILLKHGWPKKKIILVNLFSALMTVVGGLAVFYLNPSAAFEGYLLAGTAGLFLYLGASDFLPQASEGLSRTKTALVLMLGVLIMYGTLMAIPHGH
jgi:zinc and cadmium transporter